ncbi:MAG: 30S ribosomal protein S5 [Candidatus Diapherotrites archaeon]|uniref:Small ribosomal subunit protein uS5 n=1 Tax=Candidatus Iainarchaeum sp. TaxID=3101447 RepID=A0A939C454_9ARCH|nr:30S ribosomal protein S5 [Candidatus Diapherotrites archaeon]
MNREREDRKEERGPRLSEKEKQLAAWVPKTALGKKVLAGEITDLNQIFDSNEVILEPEIVDKLIELEEKMVDVKKTTRVIAAGRQFSFRVSVLVGNRNGFVGIGTAKDNEKWPAVRKAAKTAKLNLIRVRRGCGSWQCACGKGHSVPFKVTGKNASVRVTFLPAPNGVGLVAGNVIKDVLQLAGITDVWTNVKGATDTKLNFIRAAIDALAKTTSMKLSDSISKKQEAERRNA